MLKGNLVVGQNQSVVVRAESLRELVKLAESKSQALTSCGTLILRVDLAQSDLPIESLFASEIAGENSYHSSTQL